MDFTVTEEQQDIVNLSRQILTDNVTAEHLHKYAKTSGTDRCVRVNRRAASSPEAMVCSMFE